MRFWRELCGQSVTHCGCKSVTNPQIYKSTNPQIHEFTNPKIGFWRTLWTKCHSKLRMQKCSLMQLMQTCERVRWWLVLAVQPQDPQKEKHCISQMYFSKHQMMSGAGVQPRKDKHQTALRRPTTIQWYIRCTSCTHADAKIWEHFLHAGVSTKSHADIHGLE